LQQGCDMRGNRLIPSGLYVMLVGVDLAGSPRSFDCRKTSTVESNLRDQIHDVCYVQCKG